MTCVQCGDPLPSPTPDPFRCPKCRRDLSGVSFEALDRLSIRLGCETELNRRADAELARRGYVFNHAVQCWEAR